MVLDVAVTAIFLVVVVEIVLVVEIVVLAVVVATAAVVAIIVVVVLLVFVVGCLYHNTMRVNVCVVCVVFGNYFRRLIVCTQIRELFVPLSAKVSQWREREKAKNGRMRR